MNATEKLQKRYRLLFTLPSTRTSLPIAYVASFIIVVVFVLTLGSIQQLYYATLSIPLLSISLASERLLLRNNPLATFRRLLAASYVSNAFWLFPSLIGVSFNILSASTEEYASLFILGMLFAASFRLFIFGSAFCDRTTFAVAIAFIQPILISLPLVILYFSTFLGRTLPYITGIFFFASIVVYLLLVDRSAGDVGARPLPLLRAFTQTWATGHPDRIERILEQQSRDARVKTVVLSFEGGGAKPAIVTTDVHPGPLYPAGSSNLPYEMQKWFGDAGFSPLILHSISSHELNLPSKYEVQRFLSSLKNMEHKGSAGSCTEPVSTTSGKAAVKGLAFDGTAFMTVTFSPNGMEDFPRSVGEQVDQIASRIGFNRVVLIDSHNSQGETPSEEECRDVVVAAEGTLRELKDAARHPFKVGFSHSSELNIRFERDVGPAGVGVLALQINGLTHLIVAVDANNAVLGLREKVVKRLKEEGVNIFEVCTSDTHITSGKSRRAKGYFALGDLTEVDVLVDALKLMGGRAVERLSAAQLKEYAGESDVKVMGEDVLREFSQTLDSALSFAKQGGRILGVELLALLIITLVF